MGKRIISVAVCLMLLAALVPFSAVSAETPPETASGAYQLEANTPLMNSQTTGITNNAVYKIRGYGSNYYITLRNYNISSPSNTRSYDTNLNNVEVDTNTSLSDQEFRVVYNSSSDTYYIKAIKSADGTNRQLDVLSANASQIVDGKNIHIYAPGDENSSQWLIVSLGSGVYKIVLNYNQNLAITRTSGNNVQVNTYTGSSSQKWTFEEVTYTPVPIITNSIFRIKDLNSGLYVSVPGNDANLSNVALAVGDSSSAKQKFKFVYDTTNGVYYIKAMMSSNGNNRLLDVNSTASQPPVNGRNVHIYTAGDFTASAWLVDDINGRGLAKIYMNYNNHLVLTAASGGTSAGTNIQVNNYTGEAYQKWILEPVDIPVTGVQLNETNVDLIVGKTFQLYASISPSYLPQNVTWTSSMPSVATVDSNGLVTAVGIGTATITATDAFGGSSSLICRVIFNENHIYILKNFAENRYCDVYNNSLNIGNPVCNWTQTTQSNQLWQLLYTNGYYKIIPLHTNNLCIGVVSGSNTVVTQSINSSGNNVLWSIVADGNGKYSIILKDGMQNNPKYLTAQNTLFNYDLKAISANGNYSKWEITEYINDTYWDGGYTNRNNLINAYFTVDLTDWDETLFPMSYFENVAAAWNNISPNVHLIFDSPYSNDDDLPDGEEYFVTYKNELIIISLARTYRKINGAYYGNSATDNVDWDSCVIKIDIDTIHYPQNNNSYNAMQRQAILIHEMGHALKLCHCREVLEANNAAYQQPFKSTFPAIMQAYFDGQNHREGYIYSDALDHVSCIEPTLFDKTALEQKWS